MAEFCYDCITKAFPGADPAQNDMRHDRPGELVYDVCEGCGPGWFSHTGQRVDTVDPRDGNGEEPKT